MAELITLPTFQDERGALTVLEKVLPFDIKRVYWMTGVSGKRGQHRHHVTSQALMVPSGQCTVNIKRQSEKESYTLTKPNECLILCHEDWHEITDFAENTVVLLVASHHYDKNDYINEPL